MPSASRRLLSILLLVYVAYVGPLAAAPGAEAYGRLPGVELMRLSPSGQRYAFIAVIGESRRLGVLSAAGELLYTAPVGEVKVRDIWWAGDEHVLVQVTATFDHPLEFRQAMELSAVLNVDLPAHKATPIFAKTQGVAHTVLGYFGSAQIEGHRYGYFGGITYGRGMEGDFYFESGNRDLYGVDLDSGRAFLIDKAGERYHSWAIDSNGGVAAHSEYDSKEGVWRLYAGKDSSRLLMKKASPFDNIDLLGIGRTAGTVLIADNSGKEDIVVELSLSDTAIQSLFGELSLGEMQFDPRTAVLLGATTDEKPGAYFFDAHLQARFDGTRKAFPGYEMTLVSYSQNLDHLIVMTDGGDDSGTYWLVDIASGSAKPIASAYPQVKAKDVGPTHIFRYAASDGLPIEAVLTLPPGRKAEQLPVVVMPHGGPIGFHDKLGFNWWAQAYAGAGYAVLQPNYRGSSGYGRAFRDAGIGQWGGKMLSDIVDGLTALAKAGVVDPRRACIVGGSYGGYAALAGVSLQQGLYRCAVSVAGVSDLPKRAAWLTQRYGYDSSQLRYWRRATGADQGDLPLLREISPARHAAQADAPILLIHGKDDTVVPIEQSRLMLAVLKDVGKPVELLEMKGEDHWLSRETTRQQMLSAALAFVRRYNPPD